MDMYPSTCSIYTVTSNTYHFVGYSNTSLQLVPAAWSLLSLMEQEPQLWFQGTTQPTVTHVK